MNDGMVSLFVPFLNKADIHIQEEESDHKSGSFFNSLFQKKNAPGFLQRLFSLNDFHLVGNDVVDHSLFTGGSGAFPHTKPSDDMNVRTNSQLIEVFDVLAFPRSDIVPGIFDDRTAILRGVVALCQDAEIGTPGVAKVLDVDTPEIAPEFNSV